MLQELMGHAEIKNISPEPSIQIFDGLEQILSNYTS